MKISPQLHHANKETLLLMIELGLLSDLTWLGTESTEPSHYLQLVVASILIIVAPTNDIPSDISIPAYRKLILGKDFHDKLNISSKDKLSEVKLKALNSLITGIDKESKRSRSIKRQNRSLLDRDDNNVLTINRVSKWIKSLVTKSTQRSAVQSGFGSSMDRFSIKPPTTKSEVTINTNHSLFGLLEQVGVADEPTNLPIIPGVKKPAEVHTADNLKRVRTAPKPGSLEAYLSGRDHDTRGSNGMSESSSLRQIMFEPMTQGSDFQYYAFHRETISHYESAASESHLNHPYSKPLMLTLSSRYRRTDFEKEVRFLNLDVLQVKIREVNDSVDDSFIDVNNGVNEQPLEGVMDILIGEYFHHVKEMIRKHGTIDTVCRVYCPDKPAWWMRHLKEFISVQVLEPLATHKSQRVVNMRISKKKIESWLIDTLNSIKIDTTNLAEITEKPHIIPNSSFVSVLPHHDRVDTPQRKFRRHSIADLSPLSPKSPLSKSKRLSRNELLDIYSIPTSSNIQVSKSKLLETSVREPFSSDISAKDRSQSIRKNSQSSPARVSTAPTQVLRRSSTVGIKALLSISKQSSADRATAKSADPNVSRSMKSAAAVSIQKPSSSPQLRRNSSKPSLRLPLVQNEGKATPRALRKASLKQAKSSSKDTTPVIATVSHGIINGGSNMDKKKIVAGPKKILSPRQQSRMLAWTALTSSKTPQRRKSTTDINTMKNSTVIVTNIDYGDDSHGDDQYDSEPVVNYRTNPFKVLNAVTDEPDDEAESVVYGEEGKGKGDDESYGDDFDDINLLLVPDTATTQDVELLQVVDPDSGRSNIVQLGNSSTQIMTCDTLSQATVMTTASDDLNLLATTTLVKFDTTADELIKTDTSEEELVKTNNTNVNITQSDISSIMSAETESVLVDMLVTEVADQNSTEVESVSADGTGNEDSVPSKSTQCDASGTEIYSLVGINQSDEIAQSGTVDINIATHIETISNITDVDHVAVEIAETDIGTRIDSVVNESVAKTTETDNMAIPSDSLQLQYNTKTDNGDIDIIESTDASVTEGSTVETLRTVDIEITEALYVKIKSVEYPDVTTTEAQNAVISEVTLLVAKSQEAKDEESMVDECIGADYHNIEITAEEGAIVSECTTDESVAEKATIQITETESVKTKVAETNTEKIISTPSVIVEYGTEEHTVVVESVKSHIVATNLTVIKNIEVDVESTQADIAQIITMAENVQIVQIDPTEMHNTDNSMLSIVHTDSTTKVVSEVEENATTEGDIVHIEFPKTKSVKSFIAEAEDRDADIIESAANDSHITITTLLAEMITQIEAPVESKFTVKDTEKFNPVAVAVAEAESDHLIEARTEALIIRVPESDRLDTDGNEIAELASADAVFTKIVNNEAKEHLQCDDENIKDVLPIHSESSRYVVYEPSIVPVTVGVIEDTNEDNRIDEDPNTICEDALYEEKPVADWDDAAVLTQSDAGTSRPTLHQQYIQSKEHEIFTTPSNSSRLLEYQPMLSSDYMCIDYATYFDNYLKEQYLENAADDVVHNLLLDTQPDLALYKNTVTIILRNARIQFSDDFINSSGILSTITSNSTYPVIECIGNSNEGDNLGDGVSCTRYIRKPCTLNDSDVYTSGQFFYPGLCFKSTVISAKYITIQIRMLTNSDDTNNGNNIQNLPTKTYEFEPVLVMLPSVVTNKIVSKKITCYIREKSASCVVGKVEVNVLISL